MVANVDIFFKFQWFFMATTGKRFRGVGAYTRIIKFLSVFHDNFHSIKELNFFNQLQSGTQVKIVQFFLGYPDFVFP